MYIHHRVLLKFMANRERESERFAFIVLQIDTNDPFVQDILGELGHTDDATHTQPRSLRNYELFPTSQ